MALAPVPRKLSVAAGTQAAWLRGAVWGSVILPIKMIDRDEGRRGTIQVVPTQRPWETRRLLMLLSFMFSCVT